MPSAKPRPRVLQSNPLEIAPASPATILMLTRSSRSGENLSNPKELANALEFYEMLKPETAKHILANWQQDPSFLMGGSNPVAEAARGHH